MLFKINGERNSGTNFINKLLEINFGNVYDQEINDNIRNYWKHGVPCNTIKQKDECVVDIFIIRNLNKWLVSMYKNPYHLIGKDNFESFLKDKQFSSEHDIVDFRTLRCLNEDDNDKTIFEIRYYKYKNIINYFENNKNVVLVNLDFIQNEDNCEVFLSELNNTYKLNKSDFVLNINHTKSNQCDKNTEYDIDIDNYIDIIEKSKDSIIENDIENVFIHFCY
jgi:hypothetical protein